MSSLVSSAFVSSKLVSSTLVPRSTRRRLLGALAAAPLAAALRTAHAQKSLPELHVYKSPTCGCCKDWIKHLQAAGFKVSFTDVPDSRFYRAKLGMPTKFASCHTALVDGYVMKVTCRPTTSRSCCGAGPMRLAWPRPACRWARPAWTAPNTRARLTRTTCC